MMSPKTWAVAADMFSASVKVPACGEPVSATGLPGVPVTGVGVGKGTTSGRSLATLAGVNSEVVTPAGVGTATGGSTVASAGVLTGLTCATGDVLAGVFFADADADADATLTDCDAEGIAAIAGLVAASAVAVSVTDVTELAEDATAIWACSEYAAGASDVPSDPTAQEAEPFPPGQRPVNLAAWPCGEAASVTDTPDAEPFWTDTCTVKDAAWPRLIPDCDACTLTHNSACEADGEADEPADRASHWELAAASAIPGRPATRPHAAEPAPMRHAASTRAVRRRIRTILFPSLHGYSCAYSPASASTSLTYQPAWL